MPSPSKNTFLHLSRYGNENFPAKFPYRGCFPLDPHGSRPREFFHQKLKIFLEFGKEGILGAATMVLVLTICDKFNRKMGYFAKVTFPVNSC